MTRVDKYYDEYHDENGEAIKKEAPLSRVLRHQNMYDDVYMNTTLVDINNILPSEENTDLEEKKEEEQITEPEVYQEKSYSVSDYIEKAHEKINPDNAKRDINSAEFKEQEDEIRRLIDSINEKETNE